MDFSRENSSGYFTAEEEGSQASGHERSSTSRASPHRFCPECNCYLEADSQEITDLQKENRRLCQQLMQQAESSRRERYRWMDLKQIPDRTKTKLTHSCSENKLLQHQLQVCQKDNDSLKKKLLRSQRKWEELNVSAELVHENAIRLKQQLSDSEKKRAQAEQTMLTYKSLVSDITDEAAQLDAEVQQLQNSHTELRETMFRAFCKVRPSLLDLHKVIILRIPNSRKNTQMWLEFLTALNVHHSDIPTLDLSECDARWNVHNVLAAWLNGRGSEPKTWGTLLNAMRERGTPFLRELADAAEDVYLRKLASLRLPFDVRCVCWKSCVSEMTAHAEEFQNKLDEEAEKYHLIEEKLSKKQHFLGEQQREITALREQLSTLQKMEVVPAPLTSDVLEQTADEARLQQLCYMATGIKQLHIGPCGGTFTLGSSDASLEFPSGAVEKDICIRYALILHGPFMFPTGYKSASVIVYINMDSAILMKPIRLFIYHWCNTEEEDIKDTLQFCTAPHSVQVGQKYYEFEEQEGADFSTMPNSAILTITEPQCLKCVRMKKKKLALYNALCFQKYKGDVGTLLFKIQFMCDSPSWNQTMRQELQKNGWIEEDSSYSSFSFARQKVKEIHTEPEDAYGPGWEASINGQHSIGEEEFLEPTTEMEKEIYMERFPPSISYKIVYTYPHLRRANPRYTSLKINIAGTNKKVTCSCRVEQDEAAYPPTSLAPHEPHLDSMEQSQKSKSSVSAPAKPGSDTPPSSPQGDISEPADVIKALKHDLDAQWREFGTHLRVEPALMDRISKDQSNVGECMLQLSEKWLSHENGTGRLPRTWTTVVQAVKDTGKALLAQTLAEQHGVQLSGQ